MLKQTIYGLLAISILVPGGYSMAATEKKPLTGYGDNTPILLTGTVGEIREDEFDLKYGGNKITVELDGWSWTGNETRYLKPGERVTVSGRIDDDLFEGREIEANNLYKQDTYTYYYTNDMYPSYYMFYEDDNAMSDGTYVSMRGKVSNISGREFTITGKNKTQMRVNTSKMDYNPFENNGLQKIEAGDSIHVYGEIDDDLFEKREIDADSIVVLSQANVMHN